MSVARTIAVAPYRLVQASLRLLARVGEAIVGPVGFHDRSWELEYARAAVNARVEQRYQAQQGR